MKAKAQIDAGLGTDHEVLPCNGEAEYEVIGNKLQLLYGLVLVLFNRTFPIPSVLAGDGLNLRTFLEQSLGIKLVELIQLLCKLSEDVLYVVMVVHDDACNG